MKIEMPERTIDSNFTGKTIDFRLDNESHILFEILRKKMYADPIRAICREITANARDAHREVGKANVPIEIYVPGEYMIVRDRGPGISPDRMGEVFCYYGRSTKRDDNKQTGGFGLGAKTPFAYVDQFIIETIVDGTKYTYIAKIDETYKGNIDLIASETTDEGNGTTIKMPVKPNDRWLFRDNLLTATKFWKVQPRFFGTTQPETMQCTLEDKDWAIYLSDIQGYNILVDGVPYQDYESNIPPKVILKFEVGEVELSSNRDHLHYSETTRRAIRNALENFDKAVVQSVKDQLDKVNTFGEVVSIIDTLPKAKDTTRTWEWKGKTFSYPFKESVQVFERRYTKLTSYHARVVSNAVTDANFILLDKDEVTSYDRQRIGLYLNSSGVKEVYLISDKNDLPVNPIALTSIKVVRTRTPGLKKTKDTIKGREWRNRRTSQYLVESPNKIVYTTTPIDALKSVYHLQTTLVEISEKDEKHIEDEPNWIPLEEYLQEELYDKVTKDKIQKIANNRAAVSTYNNFIYLAKHHPDFEFLNQKFDNKKDERIVELVGYLVDNKVIEPVVPDLYMKYPMLKLLRYVSYTDHDIIKQYVDLINKKENSNV